MDIPAENEQTLTGGQIELTRGVRIPADALRVQYARSRGPGGQNVNKVNTKAEIWAPVSKLVGMSDVALQRLRAIAGKRLTLQDEIHIAADRSRSQERNREEAITRLAVMISAALHEPKPRRKTKPSRAAKMRRVESKRRRGQIKSKRQGRADVE
jgi:ribosome-associated protein